MVWVFVAIRTLIEGDSHVLRLAIGTICMALGALHLGMQASQWIACFRMIELSDVELLPVHKIVAGKTIRPQASLVLVFVAGRTRR